MPKESFTKDIRSNEPLYDQYLTTQDWSLCFHQKIEAAMLNGASFDREMKHLAITYTFESKDG